MTKENPRTFPLTSVLSRQGRGNLRRKNVHPHPSPLPSRAREIKVKGFHGPSLPRGPLSRPPKVKMKGRDGVGEMVIVMRKGVFHPHPFPLPSRERVHF